MCDYALRVYECSSSSTKQPYKGVTTTVPTFHMKWPRQRSSPVAWLGRVHASQGLKPRQPGTRAQVFYRSGRLSLGWRGFDCSLACCTLGSVDSVGLPRSGIPEN